MIETSGPSNESEKCIAAPPAGIVARPTEISGMDCPLEPPHNSLVEGRKDWLLGLLLLLATMVAYQPAWHAGFVWDDGAHITWPELRSWHGLADIWLKLGATQQYYPLVHTFFWVEYKLWGSAPLGYHLVNILVHVFAALLLVRILRQLAVPGAWLAAFLFALHPVEVESVAWISELKNTLSTVFYLGSVLAYLRFDRQRKAGAYILSLVLFLMGLFSKTVIATMPAALLLVFLWQRKKLRWKEDVAPLAPFFVAGIGMGMLTAWMERTLVIGREAAATHLSFMDRVLIPGRVLWFYLGKLAWPHPLLFIYPRWQVSGAVWWQYVFPAAALLLAAGLWAWRRRLGDGPLVALLFFAGTLFPALGFFDTYPFRYSFVADHFQYLAGIGVLALAAAVIDRGLARIAKRLPVPRVVICAVLLTGLGALTWYQCGAYADEETLWRATIPGNPGCWMAHDNLGLILFNRGRLEEATEHFQAAVALYPAGDVEQNDLASVLVQKGLYSEALTHLKSALAANPLFCPAHANLALAYWKLGNLDAAEAQFRMALKTGPANLSIVMNLAGCLQQHGNLNEAVNCYNLAVHLAPSEPEPLRGLAGVLLATGNSGQAIHVYQQALRLAPNDQDLLVKLGYAYITQKNFDAAADCYHKALQGEPANAMLHYNLGGALELQGKAEAALLEMREALRLKPDFSAARQQLQFLESRPNN
jgi:tetratricopeptide (TPR) repeat protein